MVNVIVIGKMNRKFDLDDFTLMPAEITEVSSRSQCDPTINGWLPVFAAPMGAVVDDKNWKVFANNQIQAVVPRTVPLETRVELCEFTFVSLSLSEFTEFVEHTAVLLADHYICVDLANGHMKALISACAKAKEKFGNRLILMTGNIANPQTYYHYASAGIDYVRVSIGSGNCCTTGANTAVFYPMGSLLEKVVGLKKEISKYPDVYKSVPKIVADGGFNAFDRIIKALSLGADYVMVGQLFAECEEACGEIYTQYKAHNMWTEEEKKHLVYNDSGYHLRLRDYYGMSTKVAQKLTGRSVTHTAEGIRKYVYVNTTVPQWAENFTDYLKSAMSYTNSFNLEQFKQCEKVFITEAARRSYYK